jgi:hypothetical protein
MRNEWWILKDMKGSVRGLPEVLSRIWLVGLRESKKSLSLDNRCPGPDSKQGHPEYESRKLELCQRARCLRYWSFLSRVSIARGCRERQCSLLCLAKSILCCRARQNELARLEPNRSSFLSRGEGISVCCALSVETVLLRSGVSFLAKWRMRSV